MKKALKIIFIIVGSLCIAFTVLYVIAGTRALSRMGTARVRMAAEREKTQQPARIDTIRPYSLAARRGDILDCNGKILAASTTNYDIHFDATVNDNTEEWDGNVRLLSDSLAVILEDKSAEEYYAYFKKARSEKNRYIIICEGIDSLTFEHLHQLPMFRQHPAVSGIIIEPRQVRQYPYGSLARRTIGFIRRYPTGANNIGIEGRYDYLLSGEDGYEIVRSKWVKWPLLPAKQKVRKTAVQPKDGDDIRLTLDIGLQAKADSALRGATEGNLDVEGGCLVLVDVKSGAIRSMVNLLRDEDGAFKEYYNVAVARPFEPGAMLSPVMDIAARKCGSDGFSLEALKGKEQPFVDTLRNVVCGGEWNRSDWDILGMGKIRTVLPHDYYWSKSPLESFEKGYGIQAPSLDYLALYTALARGGEGARLHLVERDSVECYQLCTEEQAESLKQSLSDAMRQYMAFKSTNVSIVGKAGFSYIPQRTRSYVSDDGKMAIQSSFAGFFPTDEPEYSIICMVYTKPAFKNNPVVVEASSRVAADLVNMMYEKPSL